jgi:hypothetical protein
LYKEGVQPEEGRDQAGRWIIIKKKQDSQIQNKINDEQAAEIARWDDKLF